MKLSADRVVYRVSPWRRSVLWWFFGPWLLACLIGVVVGGEEARGISIVLSIFPAVGLGLWHWVMGKTRLELSTEGVCLRQIGYTLQVPWGEVEVIRLDRGREGLVTRTPMEGKGAKRLARLRFASLRSVAQYDARQQDLLGQRRLIPMEAFAWYLRKGRPLAADIRRFAPHLVDQMLST